MKKLLLILMLTVGALLFVCSIPFHIFLYKTIMDTFPWAQERDYSFFFAMWGWVLIWVEMIGGFLLVKNSFKKLAESK